MGSGTIRSHLFAGRRRSRHPRRGGQPARGHLLPRHRLPPRAARGDRFTVVYETLEADGEPLRTGRVVSAEFVNKGRPHLEAMWFQEPGQKGGYFDLDGKSLERPFLASPVAFSRVTSGFAMRFHPILHQWKAHLGIDYAAPMGTPVRSVGDGKRGIRRLAERLRQRGHDRHHGTDDMTRLRPPEPHRRARGRERHAGRADRRCRRHRLGNRPASAFRVPRERRAQGPGSSTPRHEAMALSPRPAPTSTGWRSPCARNWLRRHPARVASAR